METTLQIEKSVTWNRKTNGAIITEHGIGSMGENVSPHNCIICNSSKIQICLFNNE